MALFQDYISFYSVLRIDAVELGKGVVVALLGFLEGEDALVGGKEGVSLEGDGIVGLGGLQVVVSALFSVTRCFAAITKWCVAIATCSVAIATCFAMKWCAAKCIDVT